MTNCPQCNDDVPVCFDDYWCNACLLETLLEHTTDGIDKMRGKERCSAITTIVALQYASNIAFELLQRTHGKRLVANEPKFDRAILKSLQKDFNKHKKDWR